MATPIFAMANRTTSTATLITLIKTAVVSIVELPSIAISVPREINQGVTGEPPTCTEKIYNTNWVSSGYYTPDAGFHAFLAANAYTSKADAAFWSWLTNYYTPTETDTFGAPSKIMYFSDLTPSPETPTLQTIGGGTFTDTTLSPISVPVETMRSLIDEGMNEIQQPYLALVVLILLMVLILGPGLYLVIAKVWKGDRMMRPVNEGWLLGVDGDE